MIQAWQVNIGWLGLFFCLFIYLSTSSFNTRWIKNWALYFIYLFYMGLLRSHDPSRKFCRLARLTWVFSCFFNWIFFFNLILKHWADWDFSFIVFFSIFFLWNYPGFMTQIWQVNTGWLEFFLSFLLNVFFSIISLNIRLIENQIS
jgi:hypothetical protein